MYNQEPNLNQSKFNGNTETTTTLLETVRKELSTYNQEQCGIIYEIEEKLHLVLNKKNDNPSTGSIEVEMPTPFDFSQKIGQELQIMRNNNRRLSSILNHLSEIV
jgi:hypothetical protein